MALIAALDERRRLALQEILAEIRPQFPFFRESQQIVAAQRVLSFPLHDGRVLLCKVQGQSLVPIERTEALAIIEDPNAWRAKAERHEPEYWVIPQRAKSAV